MYKKLLMGLALIAGSVYATPSESMRINVGGVVINTDDNTLGIGKNERLLLSHGRDYGSCVARAD